MLLRVHDGPPGGPRDDRSVEELPPVHGPSARHEMTVVFAVRYTMGASDAGLRGSEVCSGRICRTVGSAA